MIIRTFNFVTWRKFRNLVKKGAECDYYCDTCDTWQSFYENGRVAQRWTTYPLSNKSRSSWNDYHSQTSIMTFWNKMSKLSRMLYHKNRDQCTASTDQKTEWIRNEFDPLGWFNFASFNRLHQAAAWFSFSNFLSSFVPAFNIWTKSTKSRWHDGYINVGDRCWMLNVLATILRCWWQFWPFSSSTSSIV